MIRRRLQPGCIILSLLLAGSLSSCVGYRTAAFPSSAALAPAGAPIAIDVEFACEGESCRCKQPILFELVHWAHGGTVREGRITEETPLGLQITCEADPPPPSRIAATAAVLTAGILPLFTRHRLDAEIRILRSGQIERQARYAHSYVIVYGLWAIAADNFSRGKDPAKGDFYSNYALVGRTAAAELEALVNR